MVIGVMESGFFAIAVCCRSGTPNSLAQPRGPSNARSAETVMQKQPEWHPSSAAPARLLLADAFFEKGHLIARLVKLFWLAVALWDRWIGPDGSEVESAVVLTTKPNA